MDQVKILLLDREYVGVEDVKNIFHKNGFRVEKLMANQGFKEQLDITDMLLISPNTLTACLNYKEYSFLVMNIEPESMEQYMKEIERNVNKLREEIGLNPATKEELDKAFQKTKEKERIEGYSLVEKESYVPDYIKNQPYVNFVPVTFACTYDSKFKDFMDSYAKSIKELEKTVIRKIYIEEKQYDCSNFVYEYLLAEKITKEKQKSE